MWLPVPRDVDGGLVTRHSKVKPRARWPTVPRFDEQVQVASDRTCARVRVRGRVCEAGGSAGRAGRTTANGVVRTTDLIFLGVQYGLVVVVSFV